MVCKSRFCRQADLETIMTKDTFTERRDRKKESRRTEDRRKQNIPVAVERRQSERRKVPRRRQIDPTTCERDYSDEEIEFMQAMDNYKRASGRMFPTCSEILEVIRALGYIKTNNPLPNITIIESTEPTTDTSEQA